MNALIPGAGSVTRVEVTKDDIRRGADPVVDPVALAVERALPACEPIVESDRVHLDGPELTAMLPPEAQFGAGEAVEPLTFELRWEPQDGNWDKED